MNICCDQFPCVTIYSMQTFAGLSLNDSVVEVAGVINYAETL